MRSEEKRGYSKGEGHNRAKGEKKAGAKRGMAMQERKESQRW